MELDRIFCVFYWLVFAVFSSPITSATRDVCVDHGYTPINGYREPIASRGYKFFPGSLIRYYCDQHFELRPAVTIQKCNASEIIGYSWRPETPPKCVKSLTCSKPAIPHATFDKVVYYEGDGLFVICEHGYTLTEYSSSVCLESGQWSHLPNCKENHCTFPTSIGHGFYTFYPPMYDVEDVPPDSLVRYTCNEGYELDPISQQRRDCREGQWTGTDPKCVREGCDPPDPALGDYLPKREHYDVHDTLNYLCHLDDYDYTRSCQSDHTWSGIPCPQTLTTKQMPDISSQHTIYCERSWPNEDHQKVKCCIEDSIGSDGIDRCCPERGLVEFVCDDGYTLRGEPSQWMCSHTKDWVAVESNGFKTMVDTPKCYRNETGRSGAVSDDVLKPVLGTAAGVLVILSVAIIIAFCRPKLNDMKRRWRELREDEDELIIDGRRILLPSYEDAVTSQDPPFPSSATTHCENDAPGPSHWHNNIQRTRTQNDSFWSASSSRGRPRPSSSSDEEMLVPDALKTESDKNNSQRHPQSLVLKAGTSVDACVIINPQPSEQMVSNTNTDTQYDQLLISEVSQLTATDRSFLDLEVEDEPRFMLSNDSEVNLESIYPKTLSQTTSKMQIKPAISDDGNHLLSYPLISVDDSPEIEICIGSYETASDSEDTLANVTEEECTAAQKPTEKNEAPVQDEDSEKKDPQQALQLQSPEHIPIVMSSQSMDHHPQLDEMGSTAV